MSTMTEKQLKTLGEKFVELSGMFLAFIERHGLDETLVNMWEPQDRRDGVTPLCETTLCHGGWLAVMFEEENLMQLTYRLLRRKAFYVKGATQVAKFLGFANKDKMKEWAARNPKIWGNNFGRYMFVRQDAFGVPDASNLFTLTDIAKHYAEVGKRCITESKKRTNKGEDQ